MKLALQKSVANRHAQSQMLSGPFDTKDIPNKLLRKDKPLLPELSELEVVRHFTQLSQLNFSIDTNFYPLGSCTMKYNPKVNDAMAMLPGFANSHPLAPEGILQ